MVKKKPSVRRKKPRGYHQALIPAPQPDPPIWPGLSLTLTISPTDVARELLTQLKASEILPVRDDDEPPR